MSLVQPTRPRAGTGYGDDAAIRWDAHRKAAWFERARVSVTTGMLRELLAGADTRNRSAGEVVLPGLPVLLVVL